MLPTASMPRLVPMGLTMLPVDTLENLGKV